MYSVCVSARQVTHVRTCLTVSRAHTHTHTHTPYTWNACTRCVCAGALRRARSSMCTRVCVLIHAQGTALPADAAGTAELPVAELDCWVPPPHTPPEPPDDLMTVRNSPTYCCAQCSLVYSLLRVGQWSEWLLPLPFVPITLLTGRPWGTGTAVGPSGLQYTSTNS